MRLKQRLIELPAGVDIVEFVQHDGKPPAADGCHPQAAEAHTGRLPRPLPRDAPATRWKSRSIEGIELHFKHLVAALGERFPIRELKLADLQGYVDRRAKAKGMYGRRLSPATIKKEIVTLRTAWNWAVKMGLVAGRFPNDGLRYPKLDEKPPFMTREEIERRIAAGGLTDAQKKDLWNALFLTLPEVAELLEHLLQSGTLPWVYPMACFAAHTGARRSELLRVARRGRRFRQARPSSFRRRRRVRGKRTTRRVPLSPFLAAVLKEWLASHPGGQYLFCNAAVVNRSRKRSRMTGYKGDKTRATTANGRLADVKERRTAGVRPDHRRRGARSPAAIAPRKPMERDQGLAHRPPQLRVELRRQGHRPAADRPLARPYHGRDAPPLPAPDPEPGAAGDRGGFRMRGGR